jgi:hypothetical protein
MRGISLFLKKMGFSRSNGDVGITGKEGRPKFFLRASIEERIIGSGAFCGRGGEGGDSWRLLPSASKRSPNSSSGTWGGSVSGFEA